MVPRHDCLLVAMVLYKNVVFFVIGKKAHTGMIPLEPLIRGSTSVPCEKRDSVFEGRGASQARPPHLKS